MVSEEIQTLRHKVDQYPENELFRFSLGKKLFDTGAYSEAVAEFDIALSKKPDWMLVAILLGKSWIELKDYAKARHYLELGRKLADEQKHETPFEETIQLLKQLPSGS